VKICVTTLYTDEIARYGRLGAANKESYAKRHGYDFAAYSSSLDPGRPPAFGKLVAIRRHLRDHDWVFWSDADSLVMNPLISLEQIIRRGAGCDMILTWEAAASPINTGQWLIRNTAWSFAALDAIAAPEARNSHPRWFEQGSFIDWLAADPARWQRLRILHPRVMNSTPATGAYPGLDLARSRYRGGDFIIHFWPLARNVTEVQQAMERYHGLAQAADRSLIATLRNQAVASACKARSWLP
jgi:hypothetical protein